MAEENKISVSVDIDLTWTNILGALIIFTGLVSLFTIKDAGFASTCIVTGAGFCGVAKMANTAYDNAHKDQQA